MTPGYQLSKLNKSGRSKLKRKLYVKCDKLDCSSSASDTSIVQTSIGKYWTNNFVKVNETPTYAFSLINHCAKYFDNANEVKLE